MARLWSWGVLTTNPFVDFSTIWIEPLIQRAVDFTHTIERDLLCTFVYFAVVGVAYLFHSPFRAHSTAATDTYGRLTKVFQTWSTVVFFCFHLGPQFFRSKRTQLQEARNENEAVPILYFPLFTAFNILFSFLHKMKRKWGLGVTYGGRLSLIGLNSLILAAVGTMHYAYCSTLYENSTNHALKAFLYSLTPAPVLQYPYRCMAKLVLLSCGFIAADYQYKKWHGFDPSRGILWSELYEFRKHPRDAAMAAEEATADTKEDWRELVAPPRVYAPAALASNCSLRPLAPAGQSGLSSCAPSYRTTARPAAASASAASLREPTTTGSLTAASSRAASAAAAAAATTATPAPMIAALRPRVLYHECPPDVNMDLVESWFDVDDASLKRVCGSTSASPLPQLLPSQPGSFASKRASTFPLSAPAPLDGLMGTKVHEVDHADPTLTRLMSFRAPRFFVEEAQEGLHPVNRPGMVPWWSTFVLFTAWQTLAGATLRFLAFDVRTIQGFTTPKIFHLHFSRSLKKCVASAEACGSGLTREGLAAATGVATNTDNAAMLHSAASAIPPGNEQSTSTATVEESVPDTERRAGGAPAASSDPLGTRRASAESKNTRATNTTAFPYSTGATAGTTTNTAAAAAAAAAAAEDEEENEDEPDVWFDWIADVGDGFNPTYAMARLLAQPMLHLPLASAKKKKKQQRAQQQKSMRRASGGDDLRAAARSHAGARNNINDSNNGEGDDEDDVSSLRSTVQMAASAPATPKDVNAASPFLSPSSPFPSDGVRPHRRHAHSDGELDAGTGEEAEAAGSVPTPPSPPFAEVLPTPGTAEENGENVSAATGEGSEGDEEESRSGPVRTRNNVNSGKKTKVDDSVRSREAVSASYAFRAPRRHTTFTGVHAPRTAASRALLGVEKNGYATLPRGSFVVVGGDLAYPSPDDETYTTRLFEPYSDAMSGNVRLQSVFHAEQQRIVVEDRQDIDAAHVHMLDAETVADVATGRGGLGVGRGTAEEALRTVPMLFAIPGNHDWFDGLTTYRKYILERTWIGGWLMPQRSSFFVLRLPFNWYMLCGDTGNTQDIDVSQRNYFLDVIERYMDAESCVILAAHEPGWLFDAMEREDKPRQPELNRVVEALGTRLRLRLAGDIHHYSRHVPTDPSSEAATLVVSGGGGAFLHGARNDRVISQGTRYVRACAFPSRTTFTNMAARLWGFRVVNWKFDMVVGILCFVILLSVLPLPVETEVEGAASAAIGLPFAPVSLAQVFSLWVAYGTKITSHVITKGIISVFPILFFWMCFASAGSDRHATLRWRLCYGAAWTFAVMLCCSGAMAFIHVQILYLMDNGFLYSAEGRWSSVMESQAKVIYSTFASHAWQILGGQQHTVSRALGAVQDLLARMAPTQWLLVVLRALDPFETFGYLSTKVSSGTMGVFAEDVSRLQILIYYIYVLFFYWIVITPVVSMLIGTFLLISVTSFDYMYDGTYSAFQIEDYKHFIRFRLDAQTRQLHAYVIAEQKPARVYELDRKFMWSLTEAGLEEHRPPHLKQHPSRWAPMQNEKRRKKAMTEVLEHFTVHPHRVPQPS